MMEIEDLLEEEDPNPVRFEEFTIPDIVKAMAVVRERLEEAEMLKTRLQKQFDLLRIRVIPGRFEAEGIENLRVAGVGRVSLTSDMHVSVPKDRKDEFYSWLRQNDLDALIQETVNSSTLKAWVKERVQAGTDIPELINVTPFTRASITKG